MATFSATYVSSSSFTISGDVTAYFPAGVICRVDCSGWAYGSVASSSYSSPNTTVTLNETVLSSPCGNAEVSVVHPSGVALHDHSDNTAGGDDVTGIPPEHSWSDKSLRFKNPNGTWGSYVNLAGDATIRKLTETAGEALSEGNLVYKKAADSEWYIAQNDGTAAESYSWGVCTESGGIANGSEGEITMFGLVGSGGATLTIGSPVWLGDGGLPTTTQPDGATAKTRLIGFAYAADEYVFIPPTLFDSDTLVQDGENELDGDQIDIDVTLDTITPDTSPGEVSDSAHLGAILKGIENFIKNGIPIKITGTAGETLAQYDFVYQDTTDSGEWKKADADAEATAEVIGIVTKSGGITDTNTGEITLLGVVTNGSWTWTPGAKIYLSGTAGTGSETAGSNERVVGYAITATSIIFNPGGTGGSGGGSTTHTITAGETLAEYDAVYLDTTDSNEAKKATNAGTEAQAEVVGIITESGGITDTNTGEVTLSGPITQAGGWAGLSDGFVYLGTSGGLTNTSPTADDTYVKPIGILAGNTLLLGQYVGWKNETSNVSIVITGTAGENLSQYDLVFSDTSNSGNWYKSDSDVLGKAAVAGIVTESGGITAAATGAILRFGEVNNGAWSFTKGAILYPSGTSGGIAESKGTYGYAIGQTDSESATKIFFNPQLGSVS